MDALTETRPVAPHRPAPIMPPESPIAMPVQSLSRFDTKARRKPLMTTKTHSPWLARLVVFGGGLGLTAYGAHEMYKVVEVGGAEGPDAVAGRGAVVEGGARRHA